MKLNAERALNKNPSLGSYYTQLRGHPANDNTRQITVDLHRTITNCEEFRLAPDSGKNRLYNVLHAYSEVDPEVGYS